MLARLCLDSGGGPYAWWRAGPWAGKSALLSTFVLRPPREVAEYVRIVSFFITARLAAQDTREAFTQVLMEQLADLLGRSLPAALTEATREACLLDLLGQSAAACRDAGRRLVLVVDGLDEDRGVTTGPDAHSIAGLLPTDPPAGMRVIVAGRPNPRVPDDVPDWHPLRDPAIIRPLPASPHARDVQRLARHELQRLLRGSPAEQDVLGLLTAAHGGLTVRDLTGLAHAPLWEVEDILHSVAGRMLQGRPSLLDLKARPEMYLLGHEELQAAATDYLSGRLAGDRERLHAWAAGWHARRWPAETPEYLLAGYFRLLDDLGDLPRMTGLACDMARHDLMLTLTGGDAAALTEISAAQVKLLAQDRPDLASLTMLALCQDRLIKRNSYLSPLLPGVLARLGSTRRAEQLARSLSYPGPRARALAEIAAAIAETEPERAHRLIGDAENLSHADSWQDETLLAVAAAAGHTGDYDGAERLCRMIKSPGSLATALGEVVCTLAAADPGRARRLADQAEQIAGSVTDPREREMALQGAAVAMARIGETDRAQRLAYDIAPEWSQGIALRALAGALTGSGRHAEAKQLADSITDISSRIGALAYLARALAEADPPWGDRIVHEARQLASQLRPRPRADALGELAAAMAVADPARSHSLADEAEEYARSAQDPGPEVTLAELAARLAAAEPDRARRLADEAERLARGDNCTRPVAVPVELAEAMAHAGHHDCARELISMLSAPETQAWATGEQAAVLARAGEYERAEQSFGTITGSRGWPAVKLAAALAHAGEYDRAERLISTITGYRTLSVAKRELSTALSKAGELDRAERLARTIAKPWHRNVALGEVAAALARSGQPDRAQEIARSIGSVWTLLDISAALARSGDPRSLRLADEVEAIARTAGTEAQITLLGRLGVALADADPDRALRLADEAEQIAAATTEPESRASALQRLADVAAGSGDYDRAEHIANTIASPRSKAQALADLAAALAETAPGPLPLSSRTCVCFRQVRRDDGEVVGGFLGWPFSAFGGGSSGGPFPVLPVQRLGGDGSGEPGARVAAAGRALSAVAAAGVGGDVLAGEGQHGGEGDGGEAGPGRDRGFRGEGRDHVVHEEQRPGFLPGQDGRPAAQDPAGAADRFLQMQKRGFHLPSRRVKSRDLRCRESAGVEQRGQDADRGGLRPAAAGAGQDGEADEPGDGVGQPGQRRVAGFLPAPAQHAVAFAEQDQPRSVLQRPDQAERDGSGGVLDPPQEMGAGGGEAEPAVHGEEAAVGEAELPRAEGALELVGEGVLAVVVAADRGGLPSHRPCLQQCDQPQLGMPAALGDAELRSQFRAVEQVQGRAVEDDQLQAERRPALGQRDVVPRGVELEGPPHRLLAEPGAALRERRPRRDRGAGPHPRPGHRERPGQDHVIALTGEKSARHEAQHGHLRGQRPLQPVPVAALGRRLSDRPGGQQLPDQAVPAQLGEPVLVVPRSRPGRDPGRQRIITLASGNTGRNGNRHGKMSAQRSSCGKRAD